MSETDASSKPFPELQVPEQSPKPECVSESAPDDSCRTADPASLSPSEISALRAFFELLDAWDKEMQHGD